MGLEDRRLAVVRLSKRLVPRFGGLQGEAAYHDMNDCIEEHVASGGSNNNASRLLPRQDSCPVRCLPCPTPLFERWWCTVRQALERTYELQPEPEPLSRFCQLLGI